MFSIGSIWREDNNIPGKPDKYTDSLRLESSNRNMVFVALMVVFLNAFWPIYTHALNSESKSVGDFSIKFPTGKGNWVLAEKDVFPWVPKYNGYDEKISAKYTYDNNSIYLMIFLYHKQSQGKELISSGNVLVKQKDPDWKIIGNPNREVNAKSSFYVRENLLLSANQKLLVWSWNRINGVNTVNDYYGKILEAKNRLFKQENKSAAIIVATQSEQADKARIHLHTFVKELEDEIQKSISDSTFK
jgi:EpsI family protein